MQQPSQQRSAPCSRCGAGPHGAGTGRCALEGGAGQRAVAADVGHTRFQCCGVDLCNDPGVAVRRGHRWGTRELLADLTVDRV